QLLIDHFSRIPAESSAKCTLLCIENVHSQFIKVDGLAFNNYDISQHHSLEQERLSAARILFQNDPPCPVVVDEVSNANDTLFFPQLTFIHLLPRGNRLWWFSLCMKPRCCSQMFSSDFSLASSPLSHNFTMTHPFYSS
uniref:Uncharacterized protein n=1 Tax=Oryzias sinensis TaxID=183150 RepID=A0A8C8DV24_9TELE